MIAVRPVRAADPRTVNPVRPTNVVAYENAAGTWIWIFDDRHVAEAACSTGRYAARPDLGLTWKDAARIVRAIRQVVRECESTGKGSMS